MDVFLSLVLLIISILFFSMSKIQEYINKMGDKIIIETNCVEIINKMLSYYGFDKKIYKILIKQKNIFGYNVKDNSICIKNIHSNKCSEIVPSLHEVGHYVVNNKSLVIYKSFKISQYIVAINRLIILPLCIMIALLKFIFNINTIFSTNLEVKYIMVTFFALASLLKIVIGLSNEFIASRRAINFIKNYNKEILGFSILAYTYGFISQVIFMMTGIFIGILCFIII